MSAPIRASASHSHSHSHSHSRSHSAAPIDCHNDRQRQSESESVTVSARLRARRHHDRASASVPCAAERRAQPPRAAAVQSQHVTKRMLQSENLSEDSDEDESNQRSDAVKHKNKKSKRYHSHVDRLNELDDEEETAHGNVIVIVSDRTSEVLDGGKAMEDVPLEAEDDEEGEGDEEEEDDEEEEEEEDDEEEEDEEQSGVLPQPDRGTSDSASQPANANAEGAAEENGLEAEAGAADQADMDIDVGANANANANGDGDDDDADADGCVHSSSESESESDSDEVQTLLHTDSRKMTPHKLILELQGTVKAAEHKVAASEAATRQAVEAHEAIAAELDSVRLAASNAQKRYDQALASAKEREEGLLRSSRFLRDELTKKEKMINDERRENGELRRRARAQIEKQCNELETARATAAMQFRAFQQVHEKYEKLKRSYFELRGNVNATPARRPEQPSSRHSNSHVHNVDAAADMITAPVPVRRSVGQLASARMA